MNAEVRKHLCWIRTYEGSRNFGITCRRCGISRPTLRKWWRRYELEGEEGLKSRSRCPRRSPFQKVFPPETKRIQRLRRKNFGARRIQSELIRHYEFRLSLAIIHKTLTRLKVGPLVRLKQKWGQFKQYSRPIHGDRDFVVAGFLKKSSTLCAARGHLHLRKLFSKRLLLLSFLPFVPPSLMPLHQQNAGGGECDYQ